VYGNLAHVELTQGPHRYEPADPALASAGVSEDMPLDFHSPYGCSKGVADQYVLDYARSFGVPAVAFRMSCTYGPHQHGTEDQGWVAHFLLQALQNRPITIYGDGAQVRDVLFVEDLVEAMLRAGDDIHALAGSAFNIGGGPANSTSLLELIDRIEALQDRPVDVRFEAWRKGDQRWYVSDPRAFADRTGWTPRVPVAEGVERLHAWLSEHRTPRRVVSAGDAPARSAS
jgi:CDP-paratose 2-epimerase